MSAVEREVQEAAENLFAEFEAATYDEWLAAARQSLRGRSLDTLVKGSYEGIDLHALTQASAQSDSLPSQHPFRRGANAADYRARPWLIAQDMGIAEPGDFNSALHEALEGGLTAITLDERLRLETPDDLRLALAGVELGRYPLFAGGNWRGPALSRLLQAALNPQDLAKLSGCLAYDPLAQLARSGSMRVDAFERMAAHVSALAEKAPGLGGIGVSAVVYHEAGAHAVQELALALAAGVEYLHALAQREFDLDTVADKIVVELAIGEDFFMEVAKLRAAKLLWAQVARAFGIGFQGQQVRLHARAGKRGLTRREPYVNLLRLTTKALAAVIGGVDCLNTMPIYDLPGGSGAFSRRLSRNLQLILSEELRLTELIDPAGGSWHVERLTDELARRAWARFQQIEAAGGLLAALRSGSIQREIARVAGQRRQDIAAGRAVLVGLNRFVNADETLPDQQPEAQTTGMIELKDAAEPSIQVEPLPPLRLELALDAHELEKAP